MKKHFILIMMLSILVIAAGCGAKKKFEPSPIQEGVDTCAVCKMMIADDHNATQIILNNGKAYKFDDIGDLFVWLGNNKDEDINVTYVRDFHTKEWIELEDAFYIYDESFKTPMSFGVYSFKQKAEAEAYIKEQGTGVLMTASELNNHSWKSTMSHDGHDHGDHSHGDEHDEEQGDLSHGDEHGEHSNDDSEHDAMHDGHNNSEHDKEQGEHSNDDSEHDAMHDGHNNSEHDKEQGEHK